MKCTVLSLIGAALLCGNLEIGGNLGKSGDTILVIERNQ